MSRYLLCTLVLTLLSAGSVSAAEEFKAGSAFVKITPEKPMWMAGYASRNKPSEGVASELYAKAIVLEDANKHRSAIITLDLITVPKHLRNAVAAQVEQKYQIPKEAVLINCSHTHCGPEIRSPDANVTDLDSERVKQAVAYAKRLEAQLVELVGAANDNAAPATLSYQRARAGFAMNRRLPVGSDIKNSPHPDGPVDHDVPVLTVTDKQGKLTTILFGYACHNTTLSFYDFCGDYAGFAQQEIERRHPGTIAMFVMGCGGDQNPYPRGQLDLAKQHGATLALAVEAALQTPAIPVAGPLTAHLEEVKVTYATPPTKAELEQRTKEGNRYVARHAERLLNQLETDGQLNQSYTTLVQTLQFGDDLTLIALPGETVVDFSLRLKRELAGKNVWVAGYSNDVFAYVPSKRVLNEGGYEGGGALIYFTSFLHPGPFADDIEDRIVGAVHRLLEVE